MTIVEELKAKTEAYDALVVKVAEMEKANVAASDAVKIAKDAEAVAVKQAQESAANVIAVEAKLAETVKAKDAEIVTITADRDLKAKALANPAFAAAAIKGSKDSVGDAAVSVQEPSVKFASQKEALAAYKQIEGAKARAEFREENKKILGL